MPNTGKVGGVTPAPTATVTAVPQQEEVAPTATAAQRGGVRGLLSRLGRAVRGLFRR